MILFNRTTNPLRTTRGGVKQRNNVFGRHNSEIFFFFSPNSSFIQHEICIRNYGTEGEFSRTRRLKCLESFQISLSERARETSFPCKGWEKAAWDSVEETQTFQCSLFMKAHKGKEKRSEEPKFFSSSSSPPLCVSLIRELLWNFCSWNCCKFPTFEITRIYTYLVSRRKKMTGSQTENRASAVKQEKWFSAVKSYDVQSSTLGQ